MDVTPDILATIVSFFSTIIVLIISQFAMARWFDKKIIDFRTELKGDIANNRAELKGDIRLVQQKSEEAHKEINGRLNVLTDKVHDLDKGLSTLKATVDCIDDKVDSIQRRLDDAKL